MPTFLIHETMNCEVTFVRRIEANDLDDAHDGASEGNGELLGVSIGDTVAGIEHTEVLSDEPHNIPFHFYKEPD